MKCSDVPGRQVNVWRNGTFLLYQLWGNFLNQRNVAMLTALLVQQATTAGERMLGCWDWITELNIVIRLLEWSSGADPKYLITK